MLGWGDREMLGWAQGGVFGWRCWKVLGWTKKRMQTGMSIISKYELRILSDIIDYELAI